MRSGRELEYIPQHLDSHFLDSRLPDSKIAPLKKMVQELRNELAKSQRAANEQKDGLNEIIRSLHADLHTQETSLSAFSLSCWLTLPWQSFCYSYPSNEKIVILNKVVRLAGLRFLNSLSVIHIPCTKKATLNKVVHDLRKEQESLNKTNNSLCADLRTRNESSSALHIQHADAQHKADSLIQINRAHEQKHQCESLYTQGHIHGATKCLLEMLNTVDEDVRANKLIMNQLAGEFLCHALG